MGGWLPSGFQLGGRGPSPLDAQTEHALGCSLLVPWLGLLHLGPHGFCCFWSEAWPLDGGPNLGGVTVLSQLPQLTSSLIGQQARSWLPFTVAGPSAQDMVFWTPAQHSGPRPCVPAGRLVLPQDAVSHWGRVHGFGHGASGPEPVRWGSVGSLRAEGIAGWSHSGT